MKTKIFKILVKFLTKKGKVDKEEPLFDLKEAFSKYAYGENHMSKDQLHRFMVEYQGEQNCTLSDLEPIIEKVLKMESSHTETGIAGLSLDDFINFMLLDDFNGPLKDEVCTSYVCLIIESLRQKNYANVFYCCSLYSFYFCFFDKNFSLQVEFINKKPFEKCGLHFLVSIYFYLPNLMMVEEIL